MITANPFRVAAAAAALAVAVLVMFVEIGLLNGMLESQASLAALMRGDLVMMSAARTNLHEWGDIDRIRISEAGGVTGVDRVVPVYQGGMELINAPDPVPHRVIGFAFPPTELPLAIGDPKTVAAALARPDAVLFDRLSRPIYGQIAAGTTIKLDERSYAVAALVAMGPDLVADGAVMMSEGTWLSARPYANPILGVVHVAPGASISQVQRLLEEKMPDVAVLTPRQIYWREIAFTLRAAPIGFIFGIGVATGLFIGAIICYQILFNEMFDQAREFATLQAIGFGASLFHRILLEQALLLAAAGLAIGAPLSLLAFHLLSRATRMPIGIGPGSAALVVVLTIGMALLAGVLAFRHIRLADPVDLFA